MHSKPKICAKQHVDKHVVKMILESAQMLCTTHHLHPNQKTNYVIPYKKSFVNHPCTKWVRSSITNYKWLVELTTALNGEYRYRYDKKVNHKSFDAINNIPNFPDPEKDLQYYLDRYNDEPNYKDWFDRNFPDQTIEEVVC